MSRRTPPESPVACHGPGFRLDLSRCVGCGSCVLACRIENDLPSEVSWRRVLTINASRIGGGPAFHLSIACHHCERPPCVDACPSGALEKGRDGFVLLREERCIGCRYCEMACPFGAPSFDAGSGVMTKCHLCHHRVEEGLDPACVVACPTGALGFQDSTTGPPQEPHHPASATPGFGDPVGAAPGFWTVPPGGRLRSEWFQRLVTLVSERENGSHGET